MGEHSESQLLSNPPPIALNSGQSSQLVANVSSKIHIIISFNGKYTLPSLSMGNWNIFDKSLKYFWMNENLFRISIEKSFRKCGSVIKYKKSSGP